MKRCTSCGEQHPLASFYRNRARRDGLDTRCKSCQKARSRTLRARANWSAARQRRKVATFALLGGACVCCGESSTDLLTIDHRDNDGRADGVYGDPLYRRVRQDTSRFELRCWNCNSGRGHGRCPHELFNVFDPSTWRQPDLGPATLRALGF